MTYALQWRKLRTTTRWGAAALVIALGAAVLGIWLDSHAKARRFTLILGGAAILCWAVLLALLIYQSYFRCPRCGQFFSRRMWWTPLWPARHCMHCGLKLYHEA